MSAPPPREHVRPARAGRGHRGQHRLTPYAVWSADCPLGRLFDILDSEEEDDMDAGLAWTLAGVGT